jgi:hypothetical protein
MLRPIKRSLAQIIPGATILKGWNLPNQLSSSTVGDDFLRTVCPSESPTIRQRSLPRRLCGKITLRVTGLFLLPAASYVSRPLYRDPLWLSIKRPIRKIATLAGFVKT